MPLSYQLQQNDGCSINICNKNSNEIKKMQEKPHIIAKTFEFYWISPPEL